MQSRTILTNEELDTIDLATDNLPAVDTPDACDKAAIRWVKYFSYIHCKKNIHDLKELSIYNNTPKDDLKSMETPGF